MIQLIYITSAVRPMSDAELLALLQQSRATNTEVDLTGILLYSGGNFLQVLEGDEAAVDALMARIERDPRHRNLITLVRRPIPERMFPTWSMGFRRLDTLTDEALTPEDLELRQYLASSRSAQEFLGRRDRFLRLLDSFRAVNDVALQL